MPRKHIEINIRQCKLDACQKCINRDLRNKHCEEGVCEYPSAFDNLPIRCVGHWANDKIYYLTQYFGIFATGMHKRWENLYYVDSYPYKPIIPFTLFKAHIVMKT